MLILTISVDSDGIDIDLSVPGNQPPFVPTNAPFLLLGGIIKRIFSDHIWPGKGQLHIEIRSTACRMRGRADQSVVVVSSTRYNGF
jgi:hypothetical protein